MRSPSRRVLVAGSGAAGTLTALHLVRESARRSARVEVVLLDPAERWARSAGFSTKDEQHLLNVPASGLSALPDEPDHFVEWRSRAGVGCGPYGFAPRREYARYLDETLEDALRAAPTASVLRLRNRVVGLQPTGAGVVAQMSTGDLFAADAAVLAIGLPRAGDQWAPAAIRESACFVRDPLAAGALDGVGRARTGPLDVLLVGTGLTTVDVTLTLAAAADRRARRLMAISRSGRLPAVHAPAYRAPVVPDITGWGDHLTTIRRRAVDHIADVRRSTGDWRPGVDGIRQHASTLWQRLDETDRNDFVADHATAWNAVRHRMAPASARQIRGLVSTGQLEIGANQVVDAEPLHCGGLRVRLSDGSARDVGWVLNCTGPRADIRTLGDPLLDDLLRPRAGGPLAVVATCGMGLRTVDGRLLDGNGTTSAPVWTLGALRRGELWESTAIPEIRSQAHALATGVLDSLAAPARRVAV